MKTLTTILLTLAIAVLPFLGNAQNDITIYTEPANLEYMDWSGYTHPVIPTVEMRVDLTFPNYIEQLNLDTTVAFYNFEIMFSLNGDTLDFLRFEHDMATLFDTACTLDDNFRPFLSMTGYTFGQSFEIGLKITTGNVLGPQEFEIVGEFYSDFITIDVPPEILNVTSVTSQDNNIPFALYGNPTSDYTTITTAGQATIEIYDVAGKLVHQQNLQGGRVTIDVNKFDAGTYIVRALTSDKLYTERLIIK